MRKFIHARETHLKYKHFREQALLFVLYVLVLSSDPLITTILKLTQRGVVELLLLV